MMLAPVSSLSVSEGNLSNSTMSSELEMNRWSVISERGVEANGLNHEEARRLVHRLGGEGRHGLCIITDEAAARLGQPVIREEPDQISKSA